MNVDISMKDVYSDLYEYLSKRGNELKICFLISLGYILPILLTGSIYVDDNVRVYQDFAWTVDGRYLSNFIFNFFSAGNGPLDIFPYPQIASVLIIALCAALIGFLTGCKSIYSILLSMLASPFLINNLSYRFDSLTMALSFLFVLLPFLFQSKTFSFISFSAIFICVSAYLYQLTILAFPCMAMIMCACKFKSSKPAIKDLTKSAIAFICGVGLYVFSIKLFGYNSRGDLFLSSPDPYAVVCRNIYYVYQLIASSIKSPTVIVYALFALLWAFLLIQSVKKNIFLFILDIVFPIFIFITSLLINIVLLDPWVSARTMFVLMFLFCYLTVRFESELLKKIILTTTAIFSFGFCAVYANALSAQDARHLIVLSEIKGIMTENERDTFVISGDMPYSLEADRAYRVYPLLYYVLPRYFKEGSGFSQVYAQRLMKIKPLSVKEQTEQIKNVCGGEWKRKGEIFYKKTSTSIIIRFSAPSC
ncbi:glucosyltransferase domain-containing protein [Cronobacter sakazakii]|nr:glucosyltransferase domain-containing protein [Cronobacter sakazakii]